MKKNIVFGQTGGGMSFTSQRNLLMGCLDTNSKTYVVTDPKTDLEHLKKTGYKVKDVSKNVKIAVKE